MATTTLTLPPTPGSSTGHGPARPATSTSLLPAVFQSTPAYNQQPTTPVSITTAGMSTTPSVSRPTSPSTTSASHAVTPAAPHPTSPPNSPSASSNAAPPTRWSPRRVISAAISRFIKVAKEVAVWVAIAFTIASFVRDFLDLTKDSGLSAEEKYQLYLAFRSGCEDDLRRGQHSHDCDLALSKPTSPLPGLVKRTEPGGRSRHRIGFADYRSQWAVTLIILAVMVAVSAVQKIFNKSRDQTPKPYLAEHTTSPSMDGRNGTQPRPSRHLQSSPAEDAFIPTASQPEKWSDTMKHLSMGVLFAYFIFSMYQNVMPDLKRLGITAEVAVSCGIGLVLGLLLVGSVRFLGTNHSSPGVIVVGSAAMFITVNVIISSDSFNSWFHPQTPSPFELPDDLLIRSEAFKKEFRNMMKT